MTAASDENRLRIASGNSEHTAVNTAAAQTAERRLSEKSWQMLSVSPRPQYWLMRTMAPLAKPNPKILRMENGWPPRLAAVISRSPSWPSMTVSIRLTPRLITFCSAMGSVMASTPRRKPFLM